MKPARPYALPLVFVGSLSAALALGGPRPSWAQGVSMVETGVTAVEVAIGTLEEGVEQAINEKTGFAKNFSNAEVMFLLKDYGQASLILFELADDAFREQPDYDSALYYLAESQFQLENYRTSSEYFLKLMRFLATQSDFDVNKLKFAVRRVTEIAELRQDWAGIDEAVANFRRTYKGAAPADVNYLDAKSALRQGRYGTVAKLVADIPDDHPIYMKGIYLSAVDKVHEGKLEEGRVIFYEVSEFTDKGYDDFEAVRNLAAMNHARLYAEQGKFNQAVDAYQRIPRTSALFEEALFEVTWVFVNTAARFEKEIERSQFFEKARQTLELMLLAESDAEWGPDARLLYGNVLLRLGMYPKALSAFEEMVGRYSPVRDELSELVSGVTDPEEYYDELLSKRREGTSALPPMVIKWAEREAGLQSALEVVSDIERSERWLEESNQAMERLNEALTENAGPRLLAAFREWESRLNRQADALASQDKTLMNVLAEGIAANISADQRKELNRIRKERDELETNRHGALAGEDASSALEKLKVRRKDLFSLKWTIEGMNRTAQALVGWLEENENKLSPSEANQYRDMVSQARREVDALRLEHEQMKKDIDSYEFRVKTAQNNVGSAFYDELFGKQAAELEILKQAANTPEGRRLLEEVQGQHSRILGLIERLNVMKLRLAEANLSKANAIRKAIQAEQENIVGFSTSVNDMRGKARSAVGGIALDSIRNVERRFFDIVLRGDVGMVDVAWANKEEKTDEINQRVREQKQNLEMLDREYRDIMQGAEN